MKILQTLEHELRYIYVRTDLEGREHSSDSIKKCFRLVGKVFNPKTLLFYTTAFISEVGLFLFLCWGAETLQDYSETAYAMSILLVTAFGVKQFEWEKIQLFKLFDDFESVVNKRTYSC